MVAPVSEYDALLLDLDGTVYVGAGAIDHAAESLAECRQQGLALAYATNNASRTPADIAGQLDSLGIPTDPALVVTSSAVAAERLAKDHAPDEPVLIVGGGGLRSAVESHGFTIVAEATDHPQAVLQGFHPDISWQQLKQAAGALHQGADWIVTNLDTTLVTELGVAPGNGSLVQTLVTATGRTPTSVGKPEPDMLTRAQAIVTSQRPLVVGDRLDTDIAAARAAGMDSLLVLTGVTGFDDLVAAPAGQRPHLVRADLRGLLAEATEAEERLCAALESIWAHVDGNVASTGASSGLPGGIDESELETARAAWDALNR